MYGVHASTSETAVSTAAEPPLPSRSLTGYGFGGAHSVRDALCRGREEEKDGVQVPASDTEGGTGPRGSDPQAARWYVVVPNCAVVEGM